MWICSYSLSWPEEEKQKIYNSPETWENFFKSEKNHCNFRQYYLLRGLSKGMLPSSRLTTYTPRTACISTALLHYLPFQWAVLCFSDTCEKGLRDRRPPLIHSVISIWGTSPDLANWNNPHVETGIHDVPSWQSDVIHPSPELLQMNLWKEKCIWHTIPERLLENSCLDVDAYLIILT